MGGLQSLLVTDIVWSTRLRAERALARSVDFIYANLDSADGSIMLVAAIAFSFVLYADFSGYSDIAIGASCPLMTQSGHGP